MVYAQRHVGDDLAAIVGLVEEFQGLVSHFGLVSRS